jgi:uncharacterized damage-inducible protein DinB
MSIVAAYLAEFQREAPVTRRFLERLPEDRLTWKPHERSMSAGQLALHIATAPGGVARLASQDTAAMPDFARPNPEPVSVRQVLDAFDESVRAVNEVLPTFDDAAMNRDWRGMAGGQEILVLPRTIFLRNVLLNHWYQHRGQFGVYLRMLGQNVPASYGPSADEAPAALKKTA